MGKWKSRTRTGRGHGCEFGRGDELAGYGGHDPLLIITAACEQDRLLHVYSALHFATLV